MPQIPEDENSNKDEEGLVGFNFPKDLIESRREFAAQASEVRIKLKAAFMPSMLRNIEGLLAAAESESGRVLGRTERTLLVRRYYHHKLTEEVPEFGISSGRFSNIHAASIYAHVYVDKGNPEVWLVDLAEQAMQDLNALKEGQKLPRTETCFGSLQDLAADPDRAAKIQLAETIKSMVIRVDESKQYILKEALDWHRVEYLTGLEKDLTELLKKLIHQIVLHMDGTDSAPFDRIDAMGILERMALGRKLLSVLPASERGRAYLARVLNVDAESILEDGLNAEEKGRLECLARSPVHLDQVEGTLKAFRFDANWNVVPVAAADFWGPLQGDRSAIDALLKQGASVGKNVMKVYSLYTYAALAEMQLSKLSHGSFSVNVKVVRRIERFINSDFKLVLTRGVQWPKADTPPSGASKQSIAVIKGVLAILELRTQLQTLSSESPMTEQDLLKLAKSVNALVVAGAGTLEAFGAKGNVLAVGSLAKSFALWVTVVLCLVDAGLSAQNLLRAERFEAMVGHAALAGAAVLSALSVFFGAMRSVPHPLAFGIGVVGLLLSAGAGAWIVLGELKDQAALLGHTYFGKKSLVARKVGLEGEVDNDGERFEDLRYAMLEGGREDFARQIAVLLGSIGAFGFNWSKTKFTFKDRVDLQTSRKLPGYTPKSADDRNAALDKTLLPAGSRVDIFDASHKRGNPGNNASVLGVSQVDDRLPLLLTDESKEVTGLLRSAVARILRQEEEFESVPIGVLLIAERIEAVLSLPTPAWPATMQERASGTDALIPNARVIVRENL